MTGDLHALKWTETLLISKIKLTSSMNAYLRAHTQQSQTPFARPLRETLKLY